MSRRRLPWSAILCILALAAAVDAVDLWHPVDGRSWEVWRETDVAAVARNFAREGMDIRSPRIDWRGDGPGYVEMEFPIYPYLIAVGYKALGVHEQIGRVLSYVAALLTLFLFLRLAAFVLPPPGAVVAGLFFAANPIAVRLATAIQPEPFMLLGYVGATYAFVRWLDDDRWGWYWAALALTSFAILAKSPAAHIGIVFLLLIAWRRGLGALRSPRLWVFAILALLPPALWYAHAREFWLVYGNSLGVSNTHHVIGLATFTRPSYALGIAGIEVHFMWTVAGVLAVALALVLGPRVSGLGYGLLWYAAVLAYYLVIAGVSALPWGTYYHIVSVPPTALLVGWAAAVVAERMRTLAPVGRRRAGITTVVVGLTAIAANRVVDGGGRAVFIAAAAGAAVFAITRRTPRAGDHLGGRASATGVLACLTIIAFASVLKVTAAERHPTRSVPDYETAQTFAPLIPPGVRIAVSGGYCQTATESAYEKPWYLYWTDHKGFSPCVQDHTLPVVHALMGRGVRYFIVERRVLTERPAFEADMRREFPIIAETPQAVLFRLAD